MSLRTRLLQYRALTGMNQNQLAKDIGIGVVTLLKAENGRPIRETTRMRIEYYLAAKAKAETKPSAPGAAE